MKNFFFSMFVSVLIVIQSAFAQKANDFSTIIPASPDVKTGTLTNGLKYYIRNNKKPENKVELRLVVNAGSILEDNSQQGLAHFMEHMNFNGLKHLPANEIVHYLQSIGVEFGNDLNAFTSFDETVYILPVPSDNPGKLDSAFMILADWSGAALMTPDEIEKERGVILAESRLGKGADDRMMKKWLPAMFNGSKYGDRLPIGKDSIIEHFNHDVLLQFYHDWYRPNLQAVIVVGDMPVDKAEKMIIEKFSAFKNPTTTRERPESFEVKPYAQNTALVLSDKEADRTTVSINGNSYLRKPIVTEADYLNQIVENLCTNMLNARFNELRTAANPPFAFAYGYIGGWVRGYKSFNLYAMCGSNEIEKAVNALITESMSVKKYGFTEAELSRAKASMLSEYETKYNERDKTESGTFTWEYVTNFLVQDAIPGIEWEYNFLKKNINAISLKDFDDIRRKIDIDTKFFADVTAKTQAGLPSDAQLKTWIESELVKPVEPYSENKIASTLLEKEPIPGKIISTVKNEKLGTTTFTLSNKAVVCIKPTDFKNDEVLLKGSRFGGFSLYKGQDYQSAAWCNNVVEDMGYGTFSNADLRKFLSGKIANIWVSVIEYTEYIDGNSSTKDLETLFQLLYLKCTSPRKDAAAFQSFISRSKQMLESTKQNPQYLFMDTAYNTLYQGNKRAHLIESTADYDKINIDHAIEYYKQRLGSPSGMYYTIIGSFTEAQIVPLIEKYIGGIAAAEINTKYKDIGLFPKTGKQSFTLHKGSEPQAMLMHYITGKMPFNAEDNFKLEQLNAIINNKIIDTIREKMSAIYGGGLGGKLNKYPREEFLIQSWLPCSPDNLEKVNTAFFSLIESTKKTGGITELDLQKVREPALEQNKVNLKKNDYWIDVLQTSFLNGTDPDWILTKEQKLKSTRTEQLVETARKFYSSPNVFKAEWLPEISK